ncbi:MAG TPA: class I SAM-dependent methyltransferase [Chloroflexaceae bacterium]|nr:class I SAM-dependent methyltransferase [Chloroflexaceae bacterium]
MRMIKAARRILTVQRYQPAIKPYQSIDGFLSPYEAVMLYRLAAGLPAQSTIVEIGSWKGKSTYCLARGLRSGRVIAIDPFDAAGEEGSREIYAASKGNGALREQFERQMLDLGVRDKIEIFQGYSPQFVSQIPRIDLLFIDGDHSIDGAGFDFLNYAPTVVKRGYIAFHDYYPERKQLGPTWVVENKVLPSGDYQPVGIYDSLWVGRKV